MSMMMVTRHTHTLLLQDILHAGLETSSQYYRLPRVLCPFLSLSRRSCVDEGPEGYH